MHKLLTLGTEPMTLDLVGRLSLHFAVVGIDKGIESDTYSAHPSCCVTRHSVGAVAIDRSWGPHHATANKCAFDAGQVEEMPRET